MTYGMWFLLGTIWGSVLIFSAAATGYYLAGRALRKKGCTFVLSEDINFSDSEKKVTP